MGQVRPSMILAAGDGLWTTGFVSAGTLIGTYLGRWVCESMLPVPDNTYNYFFNPLHLHLRGMLFQTRQDCIVRYINDLGPSSYNCEYKEMFACSVINKGDDNSFFCINVYASEDIQSVAYIHTYNTYNKYHI
jgi:hypothetical protein